jgi:energy-converting hydrogenase Eha subunit C
MQKQKAERLSSRLTTSSNRSLSSTHCVVITTTTASSLKLIRKASYLDAAIADALRETICFSTMVLANRDRARLAEGRRHSKRIRRTRS